MYSLTNSFAVLSASNPKISPSISEPENWVCRIVTNCVIKVTLILVILGYIAESSKNLCAEFPSLVNSQPPGLG